MKYTSNTIKISFPLLIAVAFLFVAFFAKLTYISLSTVVEGTNIKELAESRTTAFKTIKADRGTIVDYQGNILAQNVNSYTVIAYLEKSRTTDERYPKHVVEKERTAEALASVLEPLNAKMTKEYILNLLKQDKYQVELGPGGKNISELIKQKIEALDLPGIDFIKTSKRYYPYGDFASYIIGYAKKYDGKEELVGELGIEEYCNRYLKGSDGKIEFQKDRYGYQLANKVSYVTKEVQDGYDVYLTIDSQVQIFVDNAVTSLLEFDPEWASITIANAKTGAIIASSSKPSFNPNVLNITNYNNPLISFTYEPGSTMKIFSFMSAIEEGVYNGEELYASGSKTIDDYTIRDWNKTGWGNISYDVGFTYSSNIAAANLAEKLGIKTLTNYYKKLGYGSKTGIELANEYPGDISIEYKTELATSSYGQGITVTPIQMIQALTSITNDGTVLKPYIIDKIVDPDKNEVIYSGKRTELNKVYSTSTVNKIKDLMDETVNGADPGITGKIYATPAVRLIGKTGTSYYVDSTGKYATGTYNNIRSFAGIFPKDDPEYIIYISTKDLKTGSSNMGKIIKNLVESISKYKNLDERESDRDESKIVDVPNILNNTTTLAESKLKTVTSEYVIIGDGSKVISQYPSKETKVSVNSKIFAITNYNIIKMPNMIGWSSKEVNDFCKLANINCVLNGYGYVKEINLGEGEILNDTSVIEVLLETKEPSKLTSEVEHE